MRDNNATQYVQHCDELYSTMRVNIATQCVQQCVATMRRSMFNVLTVLAGTADSVGAVCKCADEHLSHVPAGQPLLDETDAVDGTR